MCLHVCTGMYVGCMHTCIHLCVSWCLYTHDWWTILMRRITVGHETKTRLGPVCADMGSFLISAIMAGHNTKNKVGLPFLNNPTSLLTHLIQNGHTSSAALSTSATLVAGPNLTFNLSQLLWWPSHKYSQEWSITSLPACTQQIFSRMVHYKPASLHTTNKTIK